MSKKHTIGLVREQFEAEGYILLSDVYVNANDLLEYICPKGDIGVIKWAAWQQGHRCAKCAGVKKLTIKFIRKEFEKEGYTLLSKKYTGCAQKLEYTEWAHVVKKRDNFTCQVCGNNKGGNLVSHHLDSYNSNPNLRTALSNGVCLCKNCHKNFHHLFGYGNNTRKQFEEFMKMGV